MRAICIFILIPFTSITAGAQMDRRTVMQILDDIFIATADYRFVRPSSGTVSGKQDVAYFDPSKKSIIVEDLAIQSCRKMGQDSLNALAFIIGHELAHFYQREVSRDGHQTSFLKYDKSLETSTSTEKQADIQGVFGAYLAGYELKESLKAFMDTLYTDYRLKGKHLPGYPDLAERQRIAHEVDSIVQQLIVLYEFGQYLSLAGAYDFAADVYRHIRKYYNGSEILNNIGVNYVLQAINFTDKSVDRFVHPIELDWETRLRKPLAPSGAKDLSVRDMTKRTLLLEKAKNAFTEAIHQDPTYVRAKLNLFTTFNLLNQPKEALEYLAVSGLDVPGTLAPDDESRLKLIAGISYALLSDENSTLKFKAFELFHDIKGQGTLRHMADHNWAVLENGRAELTEKDERCTDHSDAFRRSDDPVPSTSTTIDSESKLSYAYTSSGKVRRFVISSRDHEQWSLTCGTIPPGSQAPIQDMGRVIRSHRGGYLRCVDEQIILCVGEDRKVSEVVRWEVLE